jgi:hypothetical protein
VRRVHLAPRFSFVAAPIHICPMMKENRSGSARGGPIDQRYRIDTCAEEADHSNASAVLRRVKEPVGSRRYLLSIIIDSTAMEKR